MRPCFTRVQWIDRLLVVATIVLPVACGQPAVSIPAAQDQASPTAAQTLLDISGSGSKSSQAFTAAGDWDLSWTYDCTAGLTRNGAVPSGYHCSYIVHVRTSDGHTSVQNRGVSQLGIKDQGVEHFHLGGTFYLEVSVCCSDNRWTLKVTG